MSSQAETLTSSNQSTRTTQCNDQTVQGNQTPCVDQPMKSMEQEHHSKRKSCDDLEGSNSEKKQKTEQHQEEEKQQQRGNQEQEEKQHLDAQSSLLAAIGIGDFAKYHSPRARYTSIPFCFLSSVFYF